MTRYKGPDAAELGIEPVKPQSIEGMRGLYNALTEERAESLIEAISVYPNFKTACAACFVSDRTVLNWIRRGSLPGASVQLQDFVARFLKADADHARSCFEAFKDHASKGNGVAAQVLKYMTSRWKIGDQEDLMAATELGKKKSDNLEALLTEPTPRLHHMLRVTGWIRHPAWGTPSWGAVINTTGETAPADGA